MYTPLMRSATRVGQAQSPVGIRHRSRRASGVAVKSDDAGRGMLCPIPAA
ncbi:MAG TPA: hypothetical protein VKY19_01415 [Ktedonosporobacter sp.]|nr:hypothetical protein [Ktedonosporobacter sp.]